MQAQDFAQTYVGSVRAHLCYACAGLWFDHQGSTQLSAGAVIELFKGIHQHMRDTRRPLATQLDCPRCQDALALSWDLSRTGRFSYYRCPRADGRFTPFFQFLREKQFVRGLGAAEIQRIRAQVRQIHCSDCGAPIDLEHESQCPHCHSAISFLDTEAVEKALQMWSQAENRRTSQPGALAVAEALADAHIADSGTAQRRGACLGSGITTMAQGDMGFAVDLVGLAIGAIGRLLSED